MNFTVLSMEFPITNCLSFPLKLVGIFIRLSCHKLCAEVQAKIQMSSEIKLLARTKVYYNFDPKGDNFKVNKLEDKMFGSILMGNQ